MEYKTIKAQVSAELIEKRSRFIATISPVSDEKNAVEFIEMVRKQYKDARHNVSAYIIKDSLWRYSDDGEPQGTAGPPVYEVLSRENLQHVAVVVTRYFGGILLGAPGLIRAYSKTCRLSVEASEIITMKRYLKFSLECPYSCFSQIQRVISGCGGKIIKTVYENTIYLETEVPEKSNDHFRYAVTEATSGKIKPEFMEEIFDNFDEL